MANSTPLILAVGGVFLLTWYGFRQVREERVRRTALPTPGTPDYQHTAAVALSGEFQAGLRSGDLFPGGAVLCPHCGIEFPAGVAFCDCGTETVDADEFDDIEMPFSPCGSDRDDEESEESLVCIHVAGSYWKASLVKSYLESHGIFCVTRGNVASTFSHPHLPGGGEVRLMVQPHEAGKARTLLENCG